MAKTNKVQGIDRLPSGAYRVRVWASGRCATATCATEGEARALRRALLEELAAGRTRPEVPAVETLATWGEQWMRRRADTGAVRWTPDDRRRWQKHVIGTALAALPLVDIRPRDVRAWLEGLCAARAETGRRRGQPLSRQSITHTLNLVRKALGDAVRDDVIATNPAEGVEVPKRSERSDRDPWTFLTAEEVRAVESCSSIPEGARLLFVVAIYTGLRAGELWALRWRDVHEGEARPVVVVRASHGNAPKNGKAQPVPLLPAAREAFARLRELARVEGEVDVDALVFPTSTGAQRGRGDDGRWAPESGGAGKALRWVGYRALVGITREVRFHDLRHTFASHLVMGTWGPALSLAEVRTLLRHGSIAMTERYAHLAPEHLHQRIAAAAPQRPTEAPSAPSTPSAPSSPSPLPAAPVEPRQGPEVCAPGVTVRRDGEGALETVTPDVRCAETPCFQGAPGGARTPDPRLRSPRGNAGFQGVFARRDGSMTVKAPGDPVEVPPVEAPEALALELLTAVDEGLPAGPVARALAVSVLASKDPLTAPWWRAVEVLEGGPLRVRRAVELAGMLLEGEAVQGEHTAAG